MAEKTLIGAHYHSLTEERDDAEMICTGTLPPWLVGDLVRVGPALFEIGAEKFAHWFDGQAMLYSFSMQGGEARYTNKFLASSNLKAHRSAGKIAMAEFGTQPDRWLAGRLLAAVTDRFKPSPNAEALRPRQKRQAR
jgi:carotenoid cleavage dioxygenase-like enzyme